MNLIDLAIVLLLGLAVAHGVTQGAAMQVLSFGGFWGGLVLGAALGPTVANLAGSPFSRAVVTLASLFGFATVGGVVGRVVGSRVWGTLRRLKLGVLDSALGSVIAVAATLVAVWLVALVSATAPVVANAVRGSVIVRELIGHLPAAPDVFSRIRALVDTSGFPQVFAELEPRAPAPVALPDDPAVQSAVAAAGDSTLRVVGLGCGGVQTGSSFVAARDLVVTNAHVVAGIRNPRLEDRRGRRYPATTVLFDPDLDVAVLRTSGGPAPLRMLTSDVERGQPGAFLGYPRGGGFTAGAAAVLREMDAVGRDIYGRKLTRRNIYQLQANVRQGNSGGPFVRPDGVVIGVIFAASTSDPNVGYALTSGPVVNRVQQAAAARGEVDTGPCAD